MCIRDRPIGEAAFSFGAGEFGGILLGKALGWAVGKLSLIHISDYENGKLSSVEYRDKNHSCVFSVPKPLPKKKVM